MTKSIKPNRPVSVGRMLNQLSRRLNAEMKTRLKELGLTLNGFYVLMTLLENEGLTQSELGKRLKLPAYGITRLIDSMQAAGLLERRDDPTSRRNHLIFLMDRGKTIAPEVREIIAQVNNRLLAGLSTAERQAFTLILEKLV